MFCPPTAEPCVNEPAISPPPPHPPHPPTTNCMLSTGRMRERTCYQPPTPHIHPAACCLPGRTEKTHETARPSMGRAPTTLSISVRTKVELKPPVLEFGSYQYTRLHKSTHETMHKRQPHLILFTCSCAMHEYMVFYTTARRVNFGWGFGIYLPMNIDLCSILYVHV